MFDPGDPLPRRLGWGTRQWATVDAYDVDLALFLGELACRDSDAVHVARGMARRVQYVVDRLSHHLLAARLIGDDCPPAAELPEDLRRQLEELAAR